MLFFSSFFYFSVWFDEPLGSLFYLVLITEIVRKWIKGAIEPIDIFIPL